MAIFGALVWASLNNILPTESKPQPAPSDAEIAARSLPSLPNEIRIAGNTDVQVTEAMLRSSNGERIVAGTARNNTERTIRSAELVFDLSDEQGVQLGAVSTTLRDLQPNAAVPFQFPVKQSTAALVVVSAVRAR